MLKSVNLDADISLSKTQHAWNTKYKNCVCVVSLLCNESKMEHALLGNGQ